MRAFSYVWSFPVTWQTWRSPQLILKSLGSYFRAIYIDVYNNNVFNRNVPSLSKYHNGLVDQERVADSLAQMIADGRRETGNGETRRIKERAGWRVEAKTVMDGGDLRRRAREREVALRRLRATRSRDDDRTKMRCRRHSDSVPGSTGGSRRAGTVAGPGRGSRWSYHPPWHCEKIFLAKFQSQGSP